MSDERLCLPPFSDEKAKAIIEECIANEKNSAPRFDPFQACQEMTDFRAFIKEAHDASLAPLDFSPK